MGFSCPPPPNYTRHIWHYSRANADAMKRSALAFDWDRALAQLDPDEQVNSFNDTIMNIAKTSYQMKPRHSNQKIHLG